MRTELNMRHIEAFRAVMISGSVIGASKLLNVTQPGVSRTIATLEMRLGYSLFQRKGRRLVPTSEGEALYREVEHLYVGIDRITQVAFDIKHHRAGALRLATLPALAEWLIPRVIADFSKARPEVQIFIQTLPSSQIAELVSTRQFDMGIVELPMSKSGVSIYSLPSARIVALLPQGHHLAACAELRLSDISGERLILPSPQSYLRYKIDDAFNRKGISPHVVAETPTSPIICKLVAEGAGIGLASEWAVSNSSKEKIFIKSLDVDLQSQYACLTAQSATPMVLVQNLIEMLETKMKESRSICS